MLGIWITDITTQMEKMKNLLSYLKRLNWTAFSIALLTTLLGAMGRTQDNSIFESFLVWCIVGIPLSIIFLFIGVKSKN